MKLGLLLPCLLLTALALAAQTAVPATNSTSTAATSNAGSTSMTSILPDLDRLQTAASQATTDIGHMRIEKWKADGESKRQAQSNADSIQRNLTSALPGLISAVRSAPQDLNAEFKLYRNLNALYDVFGSLTESAGAFGPKSEYEALTQQFQVIDAVRRDLGDTLERLTASTQSELAQLRSQIIRAQQQTAPVPPPKKVVVDDTVPPQKASHKKKKTAAPSSDSNTSGSDNSAAGAPKS